MRNTQYWPHLVVLTFALSAPLFGEEDDAKAKSRARSKAKVESSRAARAHAKEKGKVKIEKPDGKGAKKRAAVGKDADARQEPSQPDGERPSDLILFHTMDRNQDRMISRAEWRGSQQSFDSHDQNGDGRLAGAEVRPRGHAEGVDELRPSALEGPEDDADDVPSSKEPPPSGRGSGDVLAPLPFHRQDRNADGVLSRPEWVGDDAAFKRADRNHDGLISRDEFQSAPRQSNSGDRPARFEELDHDSDGMLHREDWYGMEEKFDSVDRNRDGMVTRPEFLDRKSPPPPQPPSPREEQLRYLDYNYDGRIERREWHGSSDEFNRLDANRDGVISREEFLRPGG